MKYENGFYMQLTRKLWAEEYESLSYQACWIYTTLKELEQRYTGVNEDFFFRSNEDLAKDCKMKLTNMKKYRDELLKTNLVHSWTGHFVDKKTGKKSEKKVTYYRIAKTY